MHLDLCAAFQLPQLSWIGVGAAQVVALVLEQIPPWQAWARTACVLRVAGAEAQTLVPEDHGIAAALRAAATVDKALWFAAVRPRRRRREIRRLVAGRRFRQQPWRGRTDVVALVRPRAEVGDRADSGAHLLGDCISSKVTF